MAIEYSAYTATEAITIPYPIEFSLTARGDGSEVLWLYLKTSVNATVRVLGNARLYDNEAGTTNEATSKTLTANVQRNVYVRLSTGTDSLVFSTKKLNTLYVEPIGATKSPVLGGDFSDIITCTAISLAGRTNFTSSISKLVCTYLHISTQTNEGVITGSANAMARVI
jgi:hypothetical protein